MFNNQVHQDTYSAITLWLKILTEYDDKYIKETIAGFKSRYIQQLAFPKTNSSANPVTLTHLQINENNFIKSAQSEKQNTENPKFDKEDVDQNAMELQIFIEQKPSKPNLEDELENLSDTLYDFVDTDENLIDFFK